MKVSDLLVHCLEQEGVRYVFGVPGEENEDVLFSMEKSAGASYQPATSKGRRLWPTCGVA